MICAALGTTSITISQLVERGFLVRGDESGRRNVGLRVTEQGHEALRDDPQIHLAHAIEDLPENTRAHLDHALAHLSARLEGSGPEDGT